MKELSTEALRELLRLEAERPGGADVGRIRAALAELERRGDAPEADAAAAWEEFRQNTLPGARELYPDPAAPARPRAHRPRRVLRTAALAAAVAAALFVAAYASSRDVRETVRTLSAERFDRSVTLSFPDAPDLYDGQTVFGYTLPESLSDYALVEPYSGRKFVQCAYADGNAGFLLTVLEGESFHTTPPEGAEEGNVTINGRPATTIASPGDNAIIIGDERTRRFIQLRSTLDLTTLRYVAEQLRYVGRAAPPETVLGRAMPALPGDWEVVTRLDDGNTAHLSLQSDGAFLLLYANAPEERLLEARLFSGETEEVEPGGVPARLGKAEEAYYLVWRDAAGRDWLLYAANVERGTLLRFAEELCAGS